ncbi:AI-2E family transporter [Gordonia sp. VNK21]|uniref:AI-2E family transporter n=1 Tax=Gordonia sp. VNK21 TaxID=3382483 RepID=UPI0038D43377
MTDDDTARPTEPSLRDQDLARIPTGVRLGAAWSWRLLLILAGIVVVGVLFKRFEDVLVPLVLALLFSAFLGPIVAWAQGRGIPRLLAVIVSVTVTLIVVVAVLGFAFEQIVGSIPELSKEFQSTIGDVRDWLHDGPLHIDNSQLQHVSNELIGWARENEGKIAHTAIGTAAFAGRVGAGILLTIFLLIFFLYEGRRIWSYLTRIVPQGNRLRVREAGAAGFGTLEHYVRATVAVALIDSAVIGIGLAALRVPLALPLTVIIFLGAFIPIVGSFAAGALAVLISLTTQGWINALIVLALLVFVMAFEGHVLQPFLLGHSVKLHPVAVILAIALGILLAGIVGGLFAVPLMAFLNTALQYRPGDPPPDPDRRHYPRYIRRLFRMPLDG